MRKGLFVFWMLFGTGLLTGQVVQYGHVREFNSNRKPLAGVQVLFKDAPAEISDDAGNFKLVFRNKAPNDPIEKEKVAKAGYEWVNEKDFELLRLSNNNELAADVILARQGVIAQARAEYYDVSLAALQASLRAEVAALEQQLRQSAITNAAFKQEKEALEASFRIQETRLNGLAETFARTNFDDVSYLYAEALEVFKAGDLEKAIAILEEADPEKQTADILKEEEKLARIRRNLGDREAAQERRKRQQIKILQLQAQFYAVKLKVSKVESIYDQILLLDDENLEVLTEAADFFEENHRYEKAFRLYGQVLEHPDARDWEKANAYVSVGRLFATVGELQEAAKAYYAAYVGYDSLSRQSPETAFYQFHLAIVHERIAESYLARGRLDTAMVYYQQERLTMERLAMANPDDPRLINSMAISYSNVGMTYMKMGHLDTALVFFRHRVYLGKRLFEVYPEETDYRIGLALGYERLGLAYRFAGHLDSALYAFNRQRVLYEPFNDGFSESVRFKHGIALAYQKLGETHQELGQMDSAKYYFHRELLLARALHVDFPLNIEFKRGLAIAYSKHGDWHLAQQEKDSALYYFRADELLSRELLEAYPTVPEYQYDMAICAEKIGTVHLNTGEKQLAMLLFGEQVSLLTRLHGEFPANAKYKNALAIAYEKVGLTYQSLQKPDSALLFFQERYRIAGELTVAYPTNVEYFKGLGIAHLRLGETFAMLGQSSEAGFHFRRRVDIAERLCLAFPKNLSLHNALLSGYRLLGNAFWVADFPDSTFVVSHIRRELAERLYNQYPDQPRLKIGLGLAFSDLGKYYLQSGVRDTALAYFKREAWLFSELHDAFPKDPELKQSYAASLSNIGTAYLAMKDLNNALEHYKVGLGLLLELTGEFPDEPRWLDNKAFFIDQMGRIHFALENYERHASFIQEGVRVREKALELQPSNPAYVYGLAMAYMKLAALIYSSEGEGWQPYLAEAEKMLSSLIENWPEDKLYQQGLEKVRTALVNFKEENNGAAEVLLPETETSEETLTVEGGEPQIVVEEEAGRQVLTLQDGNQWMAANLDVPVDGSFCPTEESDPCRPGMRLYSWEGAVEGCRSLGEGWRLPTDEEWRVLTGLYEEIEELARSGFQPEYGGIRTDNGRFYYQGNVGSYWTSTGLGGQLAWCYNFSRRNGDLQRVTDSKNYARSVRCIRN